MSGRTAAPPAVTSLAHVRRGSLVNLVGAAATTVANLGLTVLTTRLLSKHDSGLVFTATSAFLLLISVLRFGSPTGIVLFIARDPDPSTARAVAQFVLRPICALSVLTAAVGIVLATFFSQQLGWGESTRWAVIVLAVATPAAAMLDAALSVSRGLHDMRPTVGVDGIARPLVQLALTLGCALHPTVATLVAAWVLPYFPAMVAAVLVTPTLRERGPRTRLTRERRREFIRFGTPRGITNIVQIAFARLDIVLLALIVGPGAAAVYTAATRFVPMGQQVQQSVSQAGEPALARALADHDTVRAQRLYSSTTRWLVLMLWPALWATAVLAPLWLRVFGHSYDQGQATALIMVAGTLISTGLGMVETLIYMSGRSQILLGNNLGALVVMVGVDLALIPHLGPTGAAIGWATSMVLKNVVALFQLWKAMGLHPFSRGWVEAAIGSSVVFGLLPWLVRDLAGMVACVIVLVLLTGAAAAAWSVRRRPRTVGKHRAAR